MQAQRRTPLVGPFGLSALLHLSVAAAVVYTFRTQPLPSLPPIYRVNLVAAPAGPRAIGVVRPPDKTPTPATETPVTREVAPKEAAIPTKTPASTTRATPTPKKPAKAFEDQKAPRAGGGPTGGRGSDVANVNLAGIDFPFPGYLNNIVRQIALNFHPPDPNSPLSADVAFMIHRDGSVTGIRFVKRSGAYAFDLEARGAIEKSAGPKGFGPLPSGYQDDVLPIVFSFDPQILR